MARTYVYAIAGGLIATFTVTPALCGLMPHGQENETDTLVVRLMHRVYHPIVGFALANRLLTMGLMLLLLLSAGLAMRSLGLEFLPKP
jgi:cobalt-zinc-cadmium resistance protein CzcA